MIEIEPTAKVSKLADIEDSVRGTRIVIGARAVINSFVKIKPAGGLGDVTIGEGTYVNSGTVIYTGNGVTIGNGVLIAANCTSPPQIMNSRGRMCPLRNRGFSRAAAGSSSRTMSGSAPTA